MSTATFKKHHDDRKVNVILDEHGKSWPATVATQAAATEQEYNEPGRFAPTRIANKVGHFINGADYFTDVVAAMEAAQSSIFIAGWQINWDVQLVPGKRLIDVLLPKADRASL